jgi:hypothetical protein
LYGKLHNFQILTQKIAKNKSENNIIENINLTAILEYSKKNMQKNKLKNKIK